MTDDEHVTHAELIAALQASIQRLRADVEARSDPVLAEIADALEVCAGLTTHAHDHALDNRARIERLEAELAKGT